MSASVEQRLARLEAIEDIKAVKAQYCALCDADYDPDGIAAASPVCIELNPHRFRP